MTKTIYDPPCGWKYGFPRPYRPNEGETVAETLMRDGYPAEHAAFGAHHCRFIEIKEGEDVQTAA